MSKLTTVIDNTEEFFEGLQSAGVFADDAERVEAYNEFLNRNGEPRSYQRADGSMVTLYTLYGVDGPRVMV